MIYQEIRESVTLDSIKTISVDNFNPYVEFTFDVDSDKIVVIVGINKHWDQETDTYHKDSIDIEVVGVKVVTPSGNRPLFRTTMPKKDHEEAGPYHFGVRVGAANVKAMLNIIIQTVKKRYGKPIANITGERCTGASASSIKNRDKVLSVKDN